MWASRQSGVGSRWGPRRVATHLPPHPHAGRTVTERAARTTHVYGAFSGRAWPRLQWRRLCGHVGESPTWCGLALAAPLPRHTLPAAAHGHGAVTDVVHTSPMCSVCLGTFQLPGVLHQVCEVCHEVCVVRCAPLLPMVALDRGGVRCMRACMATRRRHTLQHMLCLPHPAIDGVVACPLCG